MPIGLAPIERSAVDAWVGQTAVREPIELRFRWNYLDEKGNARGRGSAIILPPDSLRFDFSGPLGSGRSAAAVIGDSGLWAVPEEEVARLVPNYPILWAMLGRALAPHPGGGLRGISDERLVAWQHASGVDTVEYILTSGDSRQLVVDVRQAGRRIGRVVTRLDAAGHPLESRLDVPGEPARVDLTFYRWDPADSLPADLWQRPVDAP
jgi:hypothetical protein